MIKFGAINIDTSHPKSFSQYFETVEERGKYVAVYNDGFRGEDEVIGFATKRNLKICKSIEELCDMVDVAIIHSCNWDKHLDQIKKVIATGKTVFVDKPIVGNMRDLDEFMTLANGGADIIGTSALRYCDEVVNLKASMKEKGLVPMHTIVTVGVDDFNYAIHAVEMILEINKETEPKSVTFLGEQKMGALTRRNFLIKFENGATAEYVTVDGKFMMFNTIVITNTTEGSTDHCFYTDNKQFYRAMMEKVIERMEGGKDVLTTCADMAKSIKVMLAGKASLDLSAGEVSLDSPLLYEVSYDGNAFEKGYAAAASKMYTNL